MLRNEIMFRIFLPPFDEILLGVLKTERFFEILHRIAIVEAVLAGIDIDRDETTGWESMDTDMTLRDDHKAAPTARILAIIARRLIHHRRGELGHTEVLWKFIQTTENHLSIIQFFIVSTVPIDHQMLSEMRHTRSE